MKEDLAVTLFKKMRFAGITGPFFIKHAPKMAPYMPCVPVLHFSFANQQQIKASVAIRGSDVTV